jgi:hypothetical protein
LIIAEWRLVDTANRNFAEERKTLVCLTHTPPHPSWSNYATITHPVCTMRHVVDRGRGSE